VAVVARAGVSVRLDLMAEHAGVDADELARLLEPITGVSIADGVVFVDRDLLVAVRDGFGLVDDWESVSLSALLVGRRGSHVWRRCGGPGR
jgi:hypothetical protein